MENSLYDRIFVRDYRRSVEIGAFQEERQILQDISISIELEVRGQSPRDDDSVDEILSYDVLVDAVESNLSARRYNLLEALAEDIADYILSFEKAVAVEIEIQKLGRIEGALGCKIRREGRRDRSSKIEATHRLYVASAKDPSKFNIPDPAIILPMLDFEEPKNAIEQHILALELDQMAWKISAHIGLPVVDSLTEADALKSRGVSFIYAFGKAPFATQPPLESWTRAALIEWAKDRLNPMSVEMIED